MYICGATPPFYYATHHFFAASHGLSQSDVDLDHIGSLGSSGAGFQGVWGVYGVE